MLAGFLVVFLVSLVYAQDEASTAAPTPAAELDITLSTQGPPPDSVVEDQPFEWEIQVRWYGAASDLNPEIQKSPRFINLEVLKPSTTIRTGADGSRQYTEKVFRYVLRPQSEGEASIGPATIRYMSPGEEKESFLSTAANSYTASPAPFSFQLWLKQMWRQGWFRGLVFGIVILMAVGVTLRVRSRYKKAIPEAPVEESNPLEEAFEAARRRRIEGDRSRFIHAIKEAVLLSLSQRFPAIDSKELASFRGELGFDRQIVLDRFLENCEQLQFAPVSPSPDELDRVMEDARFLAEPES
ncbi:MAG: hypothetical protein JXR73_23010 [Candidatus Omnitrophica bacterium]|nr:hypothetical protein [Candidatus Omnitrophota bacterium]